VLGITKDSVLALVLDAPESHQPSASVVRPPPGSAWTAPHQSRRHLHRERRDRHAALVPPKLRPSEGPSRGSSTCRRPSPA